MINRLPTVFQVYGLVYSMLVIISLNPLKAGMSTQVPSVHFFPPLIEPYSIVTV